MARGDANPLKIAILAWEVVPLVKVGGLADAVGGLAEALSALGQEVTVWLPAHRSVLDGAWPLSKVRPARPITIPVGDRRESIDLLEIERPGAAARAFVLNHPDSFDRPGVYVEASSGEGYGDELRRCAIFQRAALEGFKAIDLKPDVVLANDYQASLVPVYLKTMYSGDPLLSGTRTVLCLHNLGYQGVFGADLLPVTGLSRHLLEPWGPLEFWGRMNCLKGGIVMADRLTTVSPRYAREILAPEHGFGLDGALRNRVNDLMGILNGIDDRLWNPSTDPHLDSRYSADGLQAKERNKTALLDRVKLASSGSPLIGMVSRLVEHKGIELLDAAAGSILKEGFQLVILGNGQKTYEERMRALMLAHPRSVAYSSEFDEPLAHLIHAGSDFFLAPSRYEPCGLGQMICQRYGTLPIVRETGGLADSVRPYHPRRGEATGFSFRDFTPEALVGAVRAAASVYRNPSQLNLMRRNAMLADFSWGPRALEYLALFREMTSSNEPPEVSKT